MCRPWRPRNECSSVSHATVMAGLVPAIHVYFCRQDVDGRNKSGHDERECVHDFDCTDDCHEQNHARMNSQLLTQLLVNGLVVGTLYGVVAMSFVLIYKATQVVNFAQGELLLIGAWVCWLLLTKYQVPFYIGMPLTLIFMFAFGIAIQILILRPMIGEPIISVIMVTIGLSTVFQAALKWMFGVNPQPFPRIFTSQSVNFAGLQIQTVYVMSLVVSVLMMAGMAWFFRVSKYGLAMRATAFNQQVAQSLGISVKSVFAMAWAISATVSAGAGVGVPVVNGGSWGLSAYGIKVFPAAILGGLDSIGGAVLGGIIIGLLENIAQYVDSEYLHWGNLYEIAPFYVLIIILMIKPYGLFGTRDIERVESMETPSSIPSG